MTDKLTIRQRLEVFSGSVAALLISPAMVWAQDAEPTRYAYEHPHMWGNWGWSGMMFGPLMGIVWLAVIVAVVIVAARAFGGGTSWSGPRRGTALQILEDRFARGEIDAAEFEEKRRVLSG